MCSRSRWLVVITASALCGLGAASPAMALEPAIGGTQVITSTQLIPVTATSHSTSYASFVAYRWSHAHWVKVFGPWTARVGYNGIAWPGAKREGDGTTTSGTYRFGFFFGVLVNPGVAFPYRRAPPTLGSGAHATPPK